jgi:hypothetical protein
MADVVQAALERNDRYLREFVEALNVCPFAQRSRDEGQLERRVLLGSELDLQRTLREVNALLEATDRRIEVALFLYPELRADYETFDHFATSVRTAHELAQPEDGFFIVAFHPDAPVDTASPSRTVSLMRRSPDPTLQLVRRSVIARTKGVPPDETRWMNPADLNPEAPLPERSESLSDRITNTNFEMVRRVGLERVVALLHSMRA